MGSFNFRVHQCIFGYPNKYRLVKFIGSMNMIILYVYKSTALHGVVVKILSGSSFSIVFKKRTGAKIHMSQKLITFFGTCYLKNYRMF